MNRRRCVVAALVLWALWAALRTGRFPVPREYRHQDKAMDADHLPTPDPASPCGYPGCIDPTGPDDEIVHCDPDCGPHTPEANGHPHAPTRCTCGHPIEATR